MPAKIVPYSEQHAIRSVLFVFEFSRPVTSSALADLKQGTRLHDEIRKALPKVTEQHQLVVNLGPNGPGFSSVAATPQELSGVSFEKVKPDGEPALGLNIQTGNLFLVCGDYKRWADTFSNVEEILRLVSLWLHEHKVEASNFTLQYLDEFKVQFDNNNFEPLIDLFNVESPYIASNFSNVNGAFHSHHGFFSNPEHEIPGRLLTNVNINVAEFPEYLNAQVQATHKYSASQHITIGDENGFSTALKDAYEFLHQENKKVMRSLLTEPVKAMISFERAERIG